MYTVVAYDIEDDRRRTKLHNALKSFGTPVQYSIFECILDKERVKQMKEVVKKTIKDRKDRVRYYYLCEACQKRIEISIPGVKVVELRTIVV